jgi:hypothetical protein
MTRDKRFSVLAVVAFAVLLALLYLFAAGDVRAAPRPETRCWFADGYLYAEGLPTTYPYAITTEPYPTGTTQWSVDGTLAVYLPWIDTAYIWVRGHGPSLIKAGPQLSDFHVICIAEAA